MSKTGPNKRSHTESAAEKTDAPAKSKCKSSTRSNLNLAERIKVLDWHHKNGKNPSKTAKHFETSFPGTVTKQPLVSSWVKDEAILQEKYKSGVGLNIKRNNETEHPQVTKALQTWVQQADMAGVPLSGDVI